MNEQETIAGIIAWLRRPREGENAYLTLWRDEIADRLEAAHNRGTDVPKQRCAELNAEVVAKDAVIKQLNDAIAEEQRRKVATAEKSSAVGDCAKLREALCEILSYVESFHKYITPRRGKRLTALFAVADTILSKARAALAAPPRNCDVGTVEEQYSRMFRECHEWMCMDCKQSDKDLRKCALSWAQGPYFEEGGDK